MRYTDTRFGLLTQVGYVGVYINERSADFQGVGDRHGGYVQYRTNNNHDDRESVMVVLWGGRNGYPIAIPWYVRWIVGNGIAIVFYR